VSGAAQKEVELVERPVEPHGGEAVAEDVLRLLAVG